MAHKKPKPDVLRAEDKMEHELKDAQTPLTDRNIRRQQPSPRNKDPDNVVLEPGVAGLSDRGATGGAGLPEISTEEGRAMESAAHGARAMPSDLRDVGGHGSWDTGLAGGLGAGGEMGEGGRGHDPRKGDKWGSDIQPAEDRRPSANRQGRDEDALPPDSVGGVGGTANTAAREDRLMENKKKRRKTGLRRSRKQRG